MVGMRQHALYDVMLDNCAKQKLQPLKPLLARSFSFMKWSWCAVQDNCAKQGLQPLEAFIGKIIQLYEMIVVRHGLMLVGQSYGMKTAAHKVLAAALSDLHEKVIQQTSEIDT